MYYLINIETAVADGKVSPAVYSYKTVDELIASFHSRLGAAMKNTSVSKVLCVAMDEKGGIYRSEFWSREMNENVQNE